MRVERQRKIFPVMRQKTDVDARRWEVPFRGVRCREGREGLSNKVPNDKVVVGKPSSRDGAYT